jgi:hypothetical protein
VDDELLRALPNKRSFVFERLNFFRRISVFPQDLAAVLTKHGGRPTHTARGFAEFDR